MNLGCFRVEGSRSGVLPGLFREWLRESREYVHRIVIAAAPAGWTPEQTGSVEVFPSLPRAVEHSEGDVSRFHERRAERLT